MAFALTAPLAEAQHAGVLTRWPAELDYTAHLVNADRSRPGLLIAGN